jgi:hypothetical protein
VGERRSGTLPWIEDSPVELRALGEDRFAVRAPGHEQIVTGYDEAERTADALAERLGWAVAVSATVLAPLDPVGDTARACPRTGS